MKRLLLSLCLVGVAFSGHKPLAIQIVQDPLPSIRQLVEARVVSPPVRPTMPELLPTSGSVQMAARSPAMEDSQSIAPPRGDMQGEPLPTGESSEPSATPVPDPEQHEANWVVVIRWATVHSRPSVSAPIVGSYSVGTELQLTDHQQGWFQVLDPATSQRGWIYERYYLQAIRDPGQMVAALQETPKRNVVSALVSTPHVRRAKRLGTLPSKKTRPVIARAPRYRYETVASILDRALRP
jgi:SH3 domain-containing protein